MARTIVTLRVVLDFDPEDVKHSEDFDADLDTPESYVRDALAGFLENEINNCNEYPAEASAELITEPEGDPVLTLTATRSAGTDGALVLMVDTFEHLDQPSRPLRILLNDEDVFADAPYQWTEDDGLLDARDVTVDVYATQVAYFA